MDVCFPAREKVDWVIINVLGRLVWWDMLRWEKRVRNREGFSYIDDVKTKGMPVLVAKVARIPTFFLSKSASMEWTQPQVPIWWSMRTMAVSLMLKDLVKWDLSDVFAMTDRNLRGDTLWEVAFEKFVLGAFDLSGYQVQVLHPAPTYASARNTLA